MKQILLTCAFILTVVVQLLAADNSSVAWNKGNNFYKQKQYDSAAAQYEQVAALKPRNAVLYYNLGNTYYRLNKIGMAVLNYQRALHIDPNFKNAKENLILTQTRMSNHIQEANDIFFISWWNGVTMGSKANMWALFALVTFLAVIVLSGVIYFKIAKLPVQLPALLAFVWVCLMVLAYNASLNNKGSMMAVVMQNDAPLLSVALGQKATKPMSLLPEGTTLKILQVKGQYVEVALPDGRHGWIGMEWVNKI